MPAELSDRVDVGLLGCGREVADPHVFDHALAKRARRSHRGPPVMRGGGCDDHILSDRRPHLSPFPPAPKEQVRSIPGRIEPEFAHRAPYREGVPPESGSKMRLGSRANKRERLRVGMSL
jgi:hypothetical protein